MSKIGKKPIPIPEGVTVDISGQTINVKGPKGELSRKLEPGIKAEVTDDGIVVQAVSSSRRARQLWGLSRTLLQNMVAGVTMGFKKELELVGIGYRAEKKGDDLILALGFSHPVEFKAPAGITLEVADKTKVTVAGIDKQLVGQTAARLRALRPPEPYKGKGIRYASEVIKKKAGKAGKVGAGAFGPPAK
jgi:large subunit ribosomal protein L6